MYRILAHGPLSQPWQWRPEPDVWVIMATSLGLYAFAVRAWGPRFVSPGDPAVTKSQVRAWALGILVLWLGADWPMHQISEGYLFSVHMMQHFLFSLVAPPLLLLGTPGWLARKLLSPPLVMGAMKRLTRPLPAFLMFNAYLVFSHWPAFIDATVSSSILHFAAHLALVAVSLLMWWPVLSPLPELPRMTPPGQMFYLFGQTIVPTVPASFLTFAEAPLYSVYASAPRLFAGFDAVSDQRVAGVVMKLGGGLLLWSVIAVLFFRWSSREETGEPDPVEWQDFERTLNRTGRSQ